MSKKLSDYLHLYLGCEIMTPDGIGWLASVSRDRRKMDGLLLSTHINIDFKTMRLTENSIDGYDKKRNYGTYLIEAESYVGIKEPEDSPPEFTMPGGCKPILRPLSDMTEEERYIPQFEAQCFFLENENKHYSEMYYPNIEQASHVINKFRKMGFDCDGLIEAGLAIDKTKQENK